MALLSANRLSKHIGAPLRAGNDRSNAFLKRLEDRSLLAADVNLLHGFNNPIRQFDVNNDTHVTPLDALIIISDLNNNGSRLLGAATSATTGGCSRPSPTIRQNGSST